MSIPLSCSPPPETATLVAQIRPAVVLVGLFTALLGIAYPLAITGVGQLVFPDQANGSLVRDAGSGTIRGSALIGQSVARADLFHPRPSAAGTGYDAMASGGSNLAPTSQRLAERLATGAAAFRADSGSDAAPVPADAVTTSASGLDPDISPAYARAQIARVAAARGISPDALHALVAQMTEHPLAGVIGEPRVNVLALNRALDNRTP